MKIFKYACIAGLVMVALAACEDDGTKTTSQPAISNLSIIPTTGLTYGDSIAVSATVSDEVTPLSTFDIQVIVADVEIYKQSIRTKGNNANVTAKFKLPFAANAEDNGEVTVKLQSINIDGFSTSQTETLHAARPILGDTLYLVTSNETIKLAKSPDNPFLYLSPSGSYPNEIVGKIATSENLMAAEWVWVSSGNTIVIGSHTDSDIRLSDPSYSVEQLSFNTMTFELKFIGEMLPSVKFNTTTLLIGEDGRFHGEVEFTKGEVVTVEGITNLAAAYNPDFFDFKDGVLTFKAPSGKYQVVYWAGTINYMWLRQDNAVYPDALWLTGAGIAMPTFINDVTNIWWGWDDWGVTTRQAYFFCPKVGENKYQTTVYMMNTEGSWWLQAEFKLFPSKSWDNEFSSMDWGYISNNLTSNTNGNFVYTTELTEGLYRITIDMSGGKGNYFLIAQKIN